jgi:hypothetical protein
MSFLRTPPPDGPAPVWEALVDEERAAIVTLLAHLIAKMATALTAESLVSNQEDPCE